LRAFDHSPKTTEQLPSSPSLLRVVTISRRLSALLPGEVDLAVGSRWWWRHSTGAQKEKRPANGPRARRATPRTTHCSRGDAKNDEPHYRDTQDDKDEPAQGA